MAESVYIETSIFSFYHERRINTLLGLHVPMLVTPLELMGGE